MRFQAEGGIEMADWKYILPDRFCQSQGIADFIEEEELISLDTNGFLVTCETGDFGIAIPCCENPEA